MPAVPGDPALMSVGDALQLQQLAGNRAVRRLLAGRQIQAKLTVGPAHDSYEQEADRVAAQVMRMPESGAPAARPALAVQRQDAPEEELQQQPGPGRSQAAGFEAGQGVERELSASQGGGQPLPGETRSFMESRFGADFGAVRVHTGDSSATLNRKLSAQAFTHGSDIYFGSGQYDPGTSGGKQLLAHELTHVIQQGGTKPNKVQTKLAPRIQRTLTVGGGYFEENPNFDEDNPQDDVDEFNPVPDEGQRERDMANPDYRYVRGTQAMPAVAVTDVDDAWTRVQQAKPAISGMSAKEKKQIKARLKKWITREAEINTRSTWGLIKAGLGFKSEDRRYRSWAEVGTALVGEQGARANKKAEKSMAKRVSKSADLRRDIGRVLTKIAAKVPDVAGQINQTQTAVWQLLERPRSLKFGYWYPRGSVRTRMTAPQLNRVSSNFVIIHEAMFTLIRAGFDVFGHGGNKRAHVHGRGQATESGEVGAASFEKGGQHSLIESHPFVQSARERQLPLGAGASNTTHALMSFASMLALSAQDKAAIAWGAFVFWNKKFAQVQAVRHTFHEIMDVATLSTGGEVDYDPDAVDVYNVGYNRRGGNPPEPDNMSEEDSVESVSEMEQQGARSPEQVVSEMLPNVTPPQTQTEEGSGGTTARQPLLTYMSVTDTIPQPLTDPGEITRHMPNPDHDGWSNINTRTDGMWLMAKTSELSAFLGG
jgi:hypothetical protein